MYIICKKDRKIKEISVMVFRNEGKVKLVGRYNFGIFCDINLLDYYYFYYITHLNKFIVN